MSVSQYQNQVNTLDKELATLEKKKSEKDKEYAKLQMKIADTQKSITKSTSASMVSSKLKQISGWENEAAKKAADSADLGNRIADKRAKRNDNYLKLQKAQQDEQKKQNAVTQKMQKSYELRIAELQEQASLYTIAKPQQDRQSSDDTEEYDVFISHAFEDKADFVDDLVSEMRKLNLRVWYDTDSLKWGDSMREKIDKGLGKSKYGVVVLSPNYIAEHKYWTKAELNALFQVETINGKTVLPIWHNLTKKQVVAYSPIIADRKAMTTALMTAEEIANELKALFSDIEAEE